jgi:hypothetical protein
VQRALRRGPLRLPPVVLGGEGDLCVRTPCPTPCRSANLNTSSGWKVTTLYFLIHIYTHTYICICMLMFAYEGTAEEEAGALSVKDQPRERVTKMSAFLMMLTRRYSADIIPSGLPRSDRTTERVLFQTHAHLSYVSSSPRMIIIRKKTTTLPRRSRCCAWPRRRRR